MFTLDRSARSPAARSSDTALTPRRGASAASGRPVGLRGDSSSGVGAGALHGITGGAPLFDFARISIMPPVQRKPTVSTPADPYEREADEVADRVMRATAPASSDSAPPLIQRACAGCESKEEERSRAPDIQRDAAASGATANALPGVPAAGAGNSFGRPLDSQIQREMSRHIGYDFRNVRIYADEPAVRASHQLNARAFTAGSNIFFNEGQYQPHTAQGKGLLAHELAHVVQQSRRNGGGEPGDLLQRTTVGDVLDEFFSPWSSERLWVMGPTDAYTVIVRAWQPVKDEIATAKTSIETKCSTWASNHTTSSGGFKPTMTDPPVWDPRAYVRGVRSPPGTDPDTCKEHFKLYVASKGTRGLSLGLLPSIQTVGLHTCAIGSFALGITVDAIDCTAKTATMSVWMFNAMDMGSFGKFASHPAFKLSGMKRQYMWWNWTESHSWGPPSATGGSVGGKPSGGGGKW